MIDHRRVVDGGAAAAGRAPLVEPAGSNAAIALTRSTTVVYRRLLGGLVRFLQIKYSKIECLGLLGIITGDPGGDRPRSTGLRSVYWLVALLRSCLAIAGLGRICGCVGGSLIAQPTGRSPSRQGSVSLWCCCRPQWA